MEDLQTIAGITYLGMTDLAEQGHPLSFSVRNVTLKQVLDICFKGQPFRYRLVAGTVAILPLDQPERAVIIRGRVFDKNNEPLAGATIQLKGSEKVAVATNDSGEFRIEAHGAEPVLIVSSVNYESQEIRPRQEKELLIQLSDRENELSDVVVVHTGFQDVHRKMETGSFDEIGNELVNRRVSPNVLDRIDGVSSGVIFNTNLVTGTNQSSVTIRGRSTIFSNPNPLIVVDNFPYTGDVNNINPDDVESITILKDAAAASIWGALSGNGVIVITTKKGKLNQKPKLVFNTSQTVGAKPDLYYLPILSSTDYIDVEQYLFQQGFYTPTFTSGFHSALSPVVNLLYEDSTTAHSAINGFRTQDFRRGLSKYFYRPSLNGQVSLNLSGGSDHNQYFLSAGYDRDLSNLVRNGYNRVTIDGANTYFLLNGRLELNTDLAFTSSKTVNDNSGATGVNYPYAQVADAHGNPMPVAFGLNESFIDTAGQGQLLDWRYRPLQEMRNADNPTQVEDYRINATVRYRIRKGLDIRAVYQYGRGFSDNPNYQSEQLYSTRNLINEFSAINNGVVNYTVPLGGILVENTSTYSANNIRLQLDYHDSLSTNSLLSLIGGAEVRDIEGESTTIQLYGYDPGQQVGVPVDYTDFFPQYSNGTSAKIPYGDQKMATSERYLSYYGTGVYSYFGRYMLSASLRRDESNLFGVNENQKGVPLGSVGLAWQISKEKFYQVKGLPFLKLRITDGYNGNVNRSVSAYTTANVNPLANNFGVISASIINPPNADLRWEKIHVFNVGADFATPNDRFGGTAEFYLKTGLDLIGQSPVDPTTGVTSFTGNTANIRDRGVDLSVFANNSLGTVRWNSAFLFSFVRDKVTRYDQQQAAVIDYLNVGTLNPQVGRPLYSVYALRWKGLDPSTGNPRGYLNGTGQMPGLVTENYDSIINSPDLSNLMYKGPVSPKYFGSWRNSLYWRQWGFSFNVLYKMGYFFRRTSIDYTTLFDGSSPGHPDFDRRWQNPGDERHTNVPSMPVPNLTSNQPRDVFYQNSEVLVERGDQIRLQDVQVTCDFSKTMHRWLPMKSLRVYLYANNLGILWKANHAGIDPDFISTMPAPRTLAFGVKASF
jgi:TonB-linked SusC/RagA family outer membrane protein